MCGLAGFLSFRQSDSADRLLRAMAAPITHRGPDAAGYWHDDVAGVGLAHRRLSVLDLSEAGHQPMQSPRGRFVIVFNGEIYNHHDIRNSINALPSGMHTWRGHSDTETLLTGFEKLGVEATVAMSVGMFAFALWDRETSTLTLGRDRLGEKPLYYGWQGDTFLFGSELKAMRGHPAFTATIDRGSLSLFLRHGYIPAPYSIYAGIAKLPPGSLLVVSRQQRESAISRYWSATAVAENGVANCYAGPIEHAVDELEVLLRNAVGQQMVADVPLGAFLSGGVDSSTIVALMQTQSSRPVKTFTIGFHEQGYNEAEHAMAVAKHLGTEHTEHYVTAQEALAIIERLPALYDEPFADSSQIPTFLVSQLARHHVTVSLSGDGGDELFCGYNRYQLTQKLWRKLSFVPLPARRLLALAITSVSPDAWNWMANAADSFLPKALRIAQLGDKLHKGAGVIASESADDLYLGLVSQWQDPSSVVIGGPEPSTLLHGNTPALNGLSDVERMMALDLLTYLPDDILTKVDRAAMGASLETRVPFLDHRVVEWAWRLPLGMKMREGQSKWLLRQVLHRHVPRELIERPKVGFGVPIDAWLRGPLRTWAEALLDESRLVKEGYFHPAQIRQKWEEHLSGYRNWQHQLWNILMFQAWLESQGDLTKTPGTLRMAS
ncbi:asparagine synthase (glutamine-hydrolyzing) [Rhodoferax sp.]|uniref:asparagine synthase (glutamine-hydrolyzing) n=1 Tax=Rhodoferax sp. TaxID=50421 RepID=UPI001EB736DA|nr:asparagine synthase (glutamine-hydrolyzing) [Rhodoferax sp.]MBT9507353.1 asparagine synthase (glutamine-hydrolyzing) [Rhodoferax sp.]